MSILLRSYQQEFIEAIRAEFAAGHQSVMAVLPTGGGKTICFSYIAHNAAIRGNTTFILVHRKELIRQTSKSLTANGISHGVIASGYPEIDLPIQVCSVQTLARRLNRYHPPDLLVIDEAHHSLAASWKQIISWGPNAALLGVTATPVRSDGRGFNSVFSTMVLGSDIRTLINDGWLSDPSLHAPPIPEIDLSDVHMVAGDYNRQELGVAMDKAVITGSAVEHYKRLLPHHPPTVVFCVSVAHAAHVAAEFNANGIPAASIDGSMTDEERETLITALETGKIRVLASCDLISEGFDLPAIACAILLRPSKSLSLIIQQIGRALRISEGKTETLILDHVENWRLDGVAEAIFGKPDWWQYFEGRKKRGTKAKGASLVTCPTCYSVFPPEPTCPKCGHNLKPAGGGTGREIEEKEGELVKIDTAAVLTFKQTTASGGRRKQIIQKLERA